MKNSILVIFFTLATLGGTIIAQDIHFTQFYNAPLSVSPALAGIFNGDQRYSAIYRGQWYAANAPFGTFHGSFDSKLYNKKFGKGFMGIGGTMTHDRAGDSKLSNILVNVHGSFTHAFDTENFLTGGLMVGIGQRSFNYGDLLWEAQYNGTQVDETLPYNEQFDENGYVFEDLALGINYRGQKSGTRSKMDVGVSYFHLTRPNQSFADREVSKLEPRITAYVYQHLQISEDWDLYWNGLTQIQNKYLEAVGGFGARKFLNQTRGKELAVQAGFAFRFNQIGDAGVFTTEIQYQYWKLGMSWDLNVSEFSEATNRNGGPEISLRYIIHFVKPIPVFRVCPII